MGKWTKLAALAQLVSMIAASPILDADAEALWAPANSQTEKLLARKPSAESLWAPSSSEELWARVPKSEGKAEQLWTRVPKSEADAEELWTREGKAEELGTRAPEGETPA